MDVNSMSWVEVLSYLGGSQAAYKLEAAGGRVRLAVDGIPWPKAVRHGQTSRQGKGKASPRQAQVIYLHCRQKQRVAFQAL